MHGTPNMYRIYSDVFMSVCVCVCSCYIGAMLRESKIVFTLPVITMSMLIGNGCRWKINCKLKSVPIFNYIWTVEFLKTPGDRQNETYTRNGYHVALCHFLLNGCGTGKLSAFFMETTSIVSFSSELVAIATRIW